MRILWIGKRPVNAGESGEEVFDRKMIAACQAQGCEIDLFHPQPVSRVNEVRNMLLGVPYQRARFSASSNTRDLHAVVEQYDFAVCSWEPFDGLGRALPIPTILIVHNISSTALPALYPNNLLAKLAAMRAKKWEQDAYRSPNYVAVGALSKPDLAYLRHVGAPHPIWLPPGMPPCSDLKADARLRLDLVLSGTFGWPPKRRDVLQFAAEFDMAYPIYAAELPEIAAQQLKPRPLALLDNTDAIRFGIITDRFEAGHKLKTLAYIASNQIVLSFANVGFDFEHIPDHDLFIRRVATMQDIQRSMSQLSAMPPDILRDRFVRFKNACSRSFTWNASATTLIKATQNIIKQVSAA